MNQTVFSLALISILPLGCTQVNHTETAPTALPTISSPTAIAPALATVKVIAHAEGNDQGLGYNITISGTVRQNSSCAGAKCFSEKFKACEKATTTAKLTNAIIYSYRIIGPSQGACEVESEYTANPNPAWVGKTMNCRYDNSKPFEIAVQDLSRCSGALYSLMTGK